MRYIFALILGISIPTFKILWESRYERTFMANLDSLESLMNTEMVGSTADTYTYLIGAYGYYKNFLPLIRKDKENLWICIRPASSLVFAIFMYIFGRFFPLAYIFFFPIMIMLTYAYITKLLRIDTWLSILLLLLITPLTFYHIPRLTMEPVAVLFVLMFIINVFKGKYFLAGLFLFIAGFLRGEFSVLSLLYGAYLIYRFKKFSPSLFFVPFIFQTSLSITCGDQSNFYFWTYRAFVENVKGERYSSEKIKDCIERRLGYFPSKTLLVAYPYSKINTDCWKEIVFKEVDFVKYKGFILSQILRNAFDVVIFPVSKFSRFFKGPLLIYYALYGLLVIISVFFALRYIPNVLIVLYVVLVLIYSLYNPFGLFDSSRFKQNLIPFEISFLCVAYKSISNSRRKSLRFFK